MKIIIGCDPDAEHKGFSLYVDGRLEQLDCMPIIALYEVMKGLINGGADIELHIEDLISNKSSSFNHVRGQPKAVQNKISESVGRCKQAQKEVERVFELFDLPIVRHKVSSKWKNAAGKKEFERVTGWTGRSNEDTRSAAYFGFLGTK